MGTVVAIETTGGVAIAGDRRATRGGTVTSEHAERIFDLDGVGAGAVGGEGAVGEFRRRLDAELRRERLERDRDVDVEVLARIAGRVADDVGVDAVVGARDEEGVARVRRVGSDGSVFSDQVVALGSGAPVAFGPLEAADREVGLRATEELVRDVVETVAGRDTETGEDVDVWSLPSREIGG